DALGGVHRHGVRGTTPVLVAVVHRRQVESVAVLARQRHADVAGGVAHHEGEQLRCRLLGSEDQVSLVLAVLIIDDDHGAAVRDVLDGPFDGFDVHRRGGLDHRHLSSSPPPSSTDDLVRWTAASFSTYFASTSTSRFTESPGWLRPRVVARNVVGINATANS